MPVTRNGKYVSQTNIEDYEYFQLFDPDDPDLDDEPDPDVRTLLLNSFENYTGAVNSKKLCPSDRGWFQFHKKHLIVVGTALILAGLIIGLSIGLTLSKSDECHGRDCPSELGVYSKAAVAIDGEPCAQIGSDVLARNGTAVDAAIASLFCNGLINVHSMGIGGGFFMTIYIKATGETVTLDAREQAPAAATEDMFVDDPDKAQTGGLAVAIPGEILGYQEAKKRYGNPAVSWKSLVQPSIDMARNGVPVTWYGAGKLAEYREDIMKDPGMKAIFVNPATGDVWKEGDAYKRENLAQTLEKIAEKGADEFYTGETAKALVEDLQKLGGIMTLDDLKQYRVEWRNATHVDLGSGMTFHSVPPPGSGAVAALILNIMQLYKVQPSDDGPLLYHRLTEAFKWAYAKRSMLGDPNDKNITDLVHEVVSNITSEDWAQSCFSQINDAYTVNDPEFYGADYADQAKDHGTAHVSILAPNGDAVAATSTVNLVFGAKILSPRTGILYNDEMDDFSSPNSSNYFGVAPSPNNFIRPNKRPLSSMAPSIVVDSKGDVRLVIGAAGGTRITTAVAFTTLQNLWLGKNIKEAIDLKRIHHQLIPMQVDYHEGIDPKIVEFLKSRKHEVKETTDSNSIAGGVAVGSDGKIYANADYRKAGGVAGF